MIEIVESKFHQVNNIIFITILMILIYFVVVLNLYSYDDMDIVIYTKYQIEKLKFMLTPPSLKFLMTPGFMSAIYIAIMVAKFRFLKTVIFTRGAIIFGTVGSVLNGTVFVCLQGMQIQWAFCCTA